MICIKGSVGYERRLGAVMTVSGIKPGIGVSGCEGECVVSRARYSDPPVNETVKLRT